MSVVLQTGAEPSWCSHLRPIQRNPQRRTGLIVAALVLDRSMCQAVDVLQVLLLCRDDFADAANRTRPCPSVTWPTAVWPVADKPPAEHITSGFFLHQRLQRSYRQLTIIQKCDGLRQRVLNLFILLFLKKRCLDGLEIYLYQWENPPCYGSRKII